jgi:hypothetical protein
MATALFLAGHAGTIGLLQGFAAIFLIVGFAIVATAWAIRHDA